MKKTDILCIGTALVDSIIKGFDDTPVSASGYRAESGSLNVGGEAVNEAATAVKMGMQTGILCFLGEDQAGDMILHALQTFGVDTSCIVREKEHATPVTTMFVHADGTRRSITNTAHRYNFHPERFAERIQSARAIILGSLFRAPFDDPDIIKTVLQQAKEAGVMIFADTKLPNFHPLTLADLRECLPMVDYITPNEDEARYYTGKDTPEEMAEVFLNYGIKNVIIKLGAKGCYFRNADTELRLPAYAIEAVDATGAGDSFVAGFAAEKLRGASDAVALQTGNACGAICTTAVGATTALKDRQQVAEFIKKHKKNNGG
ncbi:MAG: carbohydrate kinase family protein [Lachnospiraceae bacterium]|nr:carbohydrate kinase family protein [Lachnospiraceae bacterium]